MFRRGYIAAFVKKHVCSNLVGSDLEGTGYYPAVFQLSGQNELLLSGTIFCAVSTKLILYHFDLIDLINYVDIIKKYIYS